MKNIKGFNEGFVDRIKQDIDNNIDKNFSLSPIRGQKKIDSGSEEYLSKFKKKYEKRTKSENILVEGLFKLEYVAYRSQSLDSARILGAMEAVLILEGVLQGGGRFDYKKSEHKFFFIRYTTQESYKEHIIRLSKEYLMDKGVL